MFVLFFALLTSVAANTTPLVDVKNDDVPDPRLLESYFIVNVASQLVLDSQGYNVTLQVRSYSPSQLFRLEPVSDGVFYIWNSASGKVLDVVFPTDSEDLKNIITTTANNKQGQLWQINSNLEDRSVECVGTGLVLDAAWGDLIEGTDLIAYPKYGTPNQIYIFERIQ